LSTHTQNSALQTKPDQSPNIRVLVHVVTGARFEFLW